jgi:hypothetical protein
MPRRPLAPAARTRRTALLVGLAVLASLAALDTARAGEGDLDPSFGTDGQVLWQAGSPFLVSTSFAALAAGDAVIATVGTRGGSGEHFTWRALDLDGQGVPGLACEGPSSLYFSGAVSSRGEAAVVDSAGRLVVGVSLEVLGTESQTRAGIARFLLDGGACALDESLQGVGSLVLDDTSFCLTSDCRVEAIAEVRASTGAVSSPRLLVLVSAAVSALESGLYLFRLEEDGDLDPTFQGGWVAVPTAEPYESFRRHGRLAVDARGRAWVLADAFDGDAPGIDLDLLLFRFDEAGLPDATFFGDGALVVDAANATDSEATGLAISPRGEAILLRSGASGGLEAQVIDPQTAASSSWLDASAPGAITTQGDGKVVLVGDPGADGLSIWRQSASAASGFDPDSSWGTAGESHQDVDGEGGEDIPEVAIAIALSAGRPIVGGTLEVDAAEDATFLLRLESDFIFADAFEQGRLGAWSRTGP